MKKTGLILLASLLILGTSCQREYSRNLSEGQFRSVIRLWERYHTDDTLKTQLLEAFKKYPGAVDEVWFFASDKWPSDFNEIREKAAKMGQAADEMRDLGIIPSLQLISLGHPDNKVTTSSVNNLGYRPAVSETGVATANQTCPRDTAFQNAWARRYAIYCEAVQPDNVMIDDDLRLTQHGPANHICFCDECIRQFNEEYGHSYTREALWKAMNDNLPGIRNEWVAFSQESLAQFARRIAEEVHKVAPNAHMGLQHVAFHEMKMEGWDWNGIFKAMRQATGNSTASRPGHGVYNDHAPRELIGKSYGISRQISRLDTDQRIIFPEMEGYYHKATGKSAQGLATETLLHLSMGANAMSYSIIASASEPMSWYADNYFRMLDRYHKLYCDYVSHNHGTEGAGIDDYISPSLLGIDSPGWENSTSGSTSYALSSLGIPFTPEQKRCSATLLDALSIQAMSRGEMEALFKKTGVVMDQSGMEALKAKGLEDLLIPKETPKDLGKVQCYRSSSGKNIAVLEGTFTSDITAAERLALLRTFDWASDGQMRVMVETMAQCYAVPRALQSDGSLRSVVYCNASITDQEDITLRLRGCHKDSEISWESASGSKRLKAVGDGDDLLVTIPFIKAWDAGWLKID